MTRSFKSVQRVLRPLLIATLPMLTLTACLFFAPGHAYAANSTYYVDCSAASNGNGSQSSPWNTLSSVDNTTFGPGDTILFNRGTTCSGQLYPKGSGSNGLPISIDAYGTGALPIINGGSNSAAVELFDQQYWSIADLEITGGDPRGIFITGNTANATLNYFRLTNLVVTNVGGATTTRNDTGLVILEPAGSHEILNDVVINGVTASNTQESEGIFVSGTSDYVGYPNQSLNTNVTIENSTAYDVGGDGIILVEAQNGLLQNNVVHNSGMCSSCSGSTPGGLWEWYCHTCTVQNNESYANQTWGVDGVDFDIDYYNSDNTLQYNYGHDSYGDCISLFGAGDTTSSAAVTTNSIIRYNVCANDDRSSAAASSGEIFISSWNNGSIDGAQIYNNTIYSNPVVPAPAVFEGAAISGANAAFFENNLIYSATTSMIAINNSNLSFQNNLYWTTNGSQPTWTYNSSTYTGFGAYQSATGQDSHGQYADPKLNNPTYHGAGMPTVEFTLQPGSPALGAGTLIAGNGGRDFFGGSVSSTAAPNIGAYNGAGFTASAPTNLVSNGGFESGLSDWSYTVGGGENLVTTAHSGSYALQTGPWSAGMYQYVSGYTPGQTYTLSGWGEVGTAGQDAWLAARVYTGSTYTDYAITFDAPTYTYGSVQFTLPANTTSVEVWDWNSSSSSALTIDDIELIELVAPTNLVSNGGFESGLSGWSYTVGGGENLVSAAHSGSYALQTGPWSAGMNQFVSGYTPGQTYTLSGWGEVSVTGQDAWLAARVFTGSSYTDYAITFDADTYTYGSVQFTLPSNTTSVEVWDWNSSSSSALTVDDIQLY